MRRNFESMTDSFEQLEEKLVLPYPDRELLSAVVDPEGTEALYKTSPVLWTRSAIAACSERQPSDVNDRELVDRLLDGGLEDWAPSLTYQLTDYLQDQGFFIFN